MGIYPEDNFQEWLEVETLTVILEQNDLTEEEALRALWNAGLIKLPIWLDDGICWLEADDEDDV